MVEGVALEMLCRLLFTEGSNPSLSVITSCIFLHADGSTPSELVSLPYAGAKTKEPAALPYDDKFQSEGLLLEIGNSSPRATNSSGTLKGPQIKNLLTKK